MGPLLTSKVHEALLAARSAGATRVSCSLDLDRSTTTVELRADAWIWNERPFPFLSRCKERTIYHWSDTGFRAGGAFHRRSDQAGADRMGTTDIRNRWHKNATHGSRLPLCGCRTQGQSDRAARQVDTRHLRRPGLLRRLVSTRPGPSRVLVRNQSRCDLAAQPQSVVARQSLVAGERRCADLDDRGHRRADRYPAGESVDAILHDPPRFGIAGELYSQAFYNHLARVLKRRGRLFHYTGSPNKLSSGRDFANEVATRLRHASFAAELNGDGVLAMKTRNV